MGAVLEDITVHIPRIVIGGQSPTIVEAALEVLAGNYPAKGEYQYELNLK